MNAPSHAHYASAILCRALDTVKGEIAAYPDDDSVWTTPPGIMNSAGTLALHLAGNLSHFIGAQLGKTGYVRDREAEFASRNISRVEIIQKLEAAITAGEASLAPLSDQDLHGDYPLQLGNTTVHSGDFMIHLVAHLGYHLGQIDYHRRLTCGGQTVSALLIPNLSSAEKK